MTDERMTETARRLAQALEPGDLDETLQRITAAAVEVLPDADYASITVLHADGRLETVAATDDLLCAVDAAQSELREGPCYEAAVDAVHVVLPDLAAEPRFPQYATIATSAGIRAQAGIRLFDAPKSRGALNLYSTSVGAFADLESLAALFSHEAAVAISYANEISDLNEALRTRTMIGQAIGIVMERFELTDERAFAFLSRLSQDRNVKLRLVALEIIASAEDRGQPV
jgi:GAF domain-containing protein